MFSLLLNTVDVRALTPRKRDKFSNVSHQEKHRKVQRLKKPKQNPAKPDADTEKNMI